MLNKIKNGSILIFSIPTVFYQESIGQNPSVQDLKNSGILVTYRKFWEIKADSGQNQQKNWNLGRDQDQKKF